MAATGVAIQTGYWVDHSKGTVLGGTLTYNSQWGSQLISAATVLVQLTGAAVWVIAAFWIHQRGATEDLRDEFDAQKQVVLRNNGSATGTILSLFNLGSTWHGHAQQAWRRSLTQMIIPAIIFAGFTVSGIFVGQIAENPDQSQVLLESNLCGYISLSGTSLNSQIQESQLFTNLSIVADAYARDCYAESNNHAVSCSSYSQPRLSYSVTQGTGCPLGPGNCQLGDNSADRLQLSYNTTCAPVSRSLLAKYTSEDNSSDIRDANNSYPILQLNLGRDLANGYPNLLNYSTVLAAYGDAIVRYSTTTFKSWYPHGEQSENIYILDSPWNESTSDISLFVIASNGVGYTAPNQDPIFSTFETPTRLGFYLPDHFFTAITCTENYQICTPAGVCTAWQPLRSLLTIDPHLDMNAAQNATYHRLVATLGVADISRAVAIPSPLRATDYLTATTVSAGLPNNQWAIEVEGWYQSTLAFLQYLIQVYAVLPETVIDRYNLTYVEPDSESMRAQCTQQRIQTPPGYTSYSVFALVFILVMSMIVISCSLWVSAYGSKVPGRKIGSKSHGKLLAYQADGMLQLQRMALEAAGYTGWRNGNGRVKEVPYVEHAEKRLPQATTLTNDHKDGETRSGDESVEENLLTYERSYTLKDNNVR